MKKITLLLIVALVTLTASATNLLTNTDFSTWTGYTDGTQTPPNGWLALQRFESASYFKSTDTPTGTGTSWKITMVGSRRVVELAQDVLPPNGLTEFDVTKSYRISIAVKQLVGANTNAKIWSQWFDATDEEITPDIDKNDPDQGFVGNMQKPITAINDVWMTFTYDCVPPAGATKFHFAFLSIGASTLLWANPSFEEVVANGVKNIDGGVKIYVNKESLELENVAIGTPIEIYTIQGKRVQQGIVSSSSFELEKLNKGVYIVKVNNSSTKIVL